METVDIKTLRQRQYTDQNGAIIPVDQLQGFITRRARQIIQDRQKRAEKISSAKQTIKLNSDKFCGLVEEIRNLISEVVSKGNNEAIYNDITQDCERLLSVISSYTSDVDALYQRIHDGKIRVAAIGLARAGKSSFHRLYTGLDDKVFPVLDGTEDTTGTIVTVQTSNKLKYEIHFFTEKEVLATINWYLKTIKAWCQKEGKDYLQVADEMGIPASKSSLTSLNEVRDFRGQIRSVPSLPRRLDIGFKRYFDPVKNNQNDWMSFVGREGHLDIEDSDDAKRFIMMNDPDMRFLATREVRVYTPIQDEVVQEMLSCFEIVDTKGYSPYAAAFANEEIRNAIKESDAIFSITKTDTTSNVTTLFEDVLDNTKETPEFCDKHFAILNWVAQTIQATGEVKYIEGDIQRCLNLLSGMNLTNVTYYGSLKTTKDGEEKELARRIMADMLVSITNVVERLDKERINRCNSAVKEIQQCITALSRKIRSVNIKEFSADSIVEKKVKELILAATKTFNRYCNNSGPDRTDASSIDPNQLPARVYMIITGNDCDESAIKNRSVDQAITSAVNHVYAKEAFEKESVPEAEIGWFIQKVATRFNDIVYQPIYLLSLPQDCDDPNPAKRMMLDQMWKDFMLDKIINNEEKWACEEVAKANDFFAELSTIYTRKETTASQASAKLFSSYKVLYNYFCEGDNRSIEPPTKGIMTLSHARLKETIIAAFKESQIEDKIEAIENAKQSIGEEATTFIGNAFNMSVKDKCLRFYKDHKDSILDENQLSQISCYSAINTVRDKINELNKISIGTIPE